MSDPDIKELAKQYANIHAAASDLAGKAAQMTSAEKRIHKKIEEVDMQLKEIRKLEVGVLASLGELAAALEDVKPLAAEVKRNAEILKGLTVE
jgi:chromosome segregation ATPase